MDRNMIMGPGSGHSMHCSICGYSGNSYYHMSVICIGHCHICNKNSRKLCDMCDEVVCEDHTQWHPSVPKTLCLKCYCNVVDELMPKIKQVQTPECRCSKCSRTVMVDKIRKKLKINIVKDES